MFGCTHFVFRNYSNLKIEFDIFASTDKFYPQR